MSVTSLLLPEVSYVRVSLIQSLSRRLSILVRLSGNLGNLRAVGSVEGLVKLFRLNLCSLGSFVERLPRLLQPSKMTTLGSFLKAAI